jgi:hypothetical protein
VKNIVLIRNETYRYFFKRNGWLLLCFGKKKKMYVLAFVVKLSEKCINIIIC